VLPCTYNYIHITSAYETTEKGYETLESCSVAGFRGRGKASSGTDSGVAEILQADQEGSDVASGCRRSGMVQTAGTRLPDEN
jgi:hypothetical protein